MKKKILLKFIIALIATGMLVSLPGWASQYTLLIFTLFGLYLALAQMWNLLAGYTGLISLGQQIFIGVGAYTLAVLTLYYQWPIWLSILCGGFVCALLALVVSIPLFRMSGVYFSIGSWIVAQALMIWFSNWAYTKKGMGLFIKAAYKGSINQVYYAAVIMGVCSVALVYFLLKSKLGLALMAMRDDVGAAEGIGINSLLSKLWCFLIASFITGITAGILYLNQVFVQPYSAFGIEWTVRLCFIVIIGGIGTVEGPIIGALIFVLLQQYLAEYASISMILLGSISVTVMLVFPKGIMGTVQNRLGYEILSPRRS
jgi:branched-chain amino acid transport system permease protein